MKREGRLLLVLGGLFLSLGLSFSVRGGLSLDLGSFLSLGLLGLLSLLGGCGAGCALSFLGNGGLKNQGDLGDGSAVTLALSKLHDAGVTALAALELGGELVEQVGNNLLVSDLLENVATISNRASLGLSDDLLYVRAK